MTSEQWLPDPDDPHFLYHYTTPEAIIGICQTRSLFAGYPLDMNDRREQLVAYEHALEYLRGQGRRAEDFCSAWLNLRRDRNRSSQHGSPFIISFTAAPDSLLHWMAYAQPYGSMAIGFMANHLRRAGEAQPHGVTFMLDKCIYDESTHRRVATEVTEAALHRLEADPAPDGYRHAMEFDRRLAMAGAFFKDPEFQIEQEWRLVSNIPGIIPTDAMAFRAGKYGIREFIKFDIWSGFESGPRPEVTFQLGPNGNVHSDYRVTDALSMVLGATGTSWGTSQSGFRV